MDDDAITNDEISALPSQILGFPVEYCEGPGPGDQDKPQLPVLGDLTYYDRLPRLSPAEDQARTGEDGVHHDDASDDGGLSMKDCGSLYPGFVITCTACSSGRVILEHNLGLSSSEIVGPWSHVGLCCVSCGARFVQDLP